MKTTRPGLWALLFLFFLFLGGGLFLLVQKGGPGPALGGTALPGGKSRGSPPPAPDPGRPQGRKKIPSEKAPKAGPLLRGRFLVPKDGPSCSIRVRVLDEKGKTLENARAEAPGSFSLPWKKEFGLQVEVLFLSEPYLPFRTWARKGGPPLLVRLRPTASGGALAWRLGPDPMAPRQDLSRLALYCAHDPRTESQETPVEDFFAGIRACSGPAPPLLEKRVTGELDSKGTYRFRAEGLPPGSFLAVVSRENSGFAVKRVEIRPGETRDLGLLDPAKKELRVLVRDGRDGAGLKGARVVPFLGLWAAGPAFFTDPWGKAKIDPFLGDAVQVWKEGYEPVLVRVARGGELKVSLRPALEAEVREEPGTWVFGWVRGVSVWRQVGPSGKLKVPVGPLDTILMLYKPWEKRWFVLPMEKGKLVRGPGVVEFHVHAGKEPLDWGGVELCEQERDWRYAAGVVGGTARIEGLRPGTYRLIVRAGPQVHDNDQEFHFQPLRIDGGKKQLDLEIPAGVMRLRLFRADGAPAAHKNLLLKGRGAGPAGRVRYRISIRAWTDSQGRVTFRFLPDLAFTLRTREFSTQVTLEGGKEQEIRLP